MWWKQKRNCCLKNKRFEEINVKPNSRSKKLQDEKQAFEKLTFEDYQTQQKTLGDRLVSLQQKVHALSSENDELKTSVRQLKKENACFRKANKQRLKRKKQKMKHKQEQSFETLKWGKPTPDQVRAAAQMAARSFAAAAIPQVPPMTGNNHASSVSMQTPQQGTSISTSDAASVAARGT
jgi:regulator of replication initiation timing